MNKINRMLLLMLVLVALIVAVPASAQTGTFGLSEGDFEFFAGANADSATKTQYTFDYEVTLVVDGAGFPIDVTLGGTGVLDAENEMFSITLNGTAAVAGQSTPLEGELRIVGEELYARGTDPTTNSDSGWFSLDLSDLSDVDFMSGDFGPELTDAFLEGFAEGAGVDAADFDPAAFENMIDALAQLNPEDFIFINRDGNLFTVEFSIPALADAPGFDAVTRELLIATALEPDPPNSFIAAFNAVIASAFENTSITLDQNVGDDGLVQQTTFSLLSTIDPADFDSSGGLISTEFVLDIQLSNYDTPASVTAPADALEIPSSVVTDALGVAPAAGASSDGGSTDAGTVTAGATSSVELTCDSRALDYEGDTGATFTGSCPANCLNGSLWGTDTYTDDSFICTAGIHAGAISTEGGPVTFVIQDGMDSYPSSTQNGVTSSEWGSWGRSFSFEVSGGGSGATGAAAGSVGINDSAIVSLPAGGTVQLPLEGSGTVTITAAGLEGADTILRVLDANGAVIAENDDNGGAVAGLDTFDSAVVDVVVSEGTILEIAEFGSAGGDVEVTVTGSGGSASSAPATTPDSIGAGESAVVTLPVGGTVQVPLEASGVVTITASGIGGADTILRVLDQNGNILAENDDHTTDLANLGGLDSAIEDLAVKSGMVIEVGEFGSAGGDVEISVIAAGSSDASGSSTGETLTVSSDLANEYIFSNGISFGYPADYTLMSESDVVTVVVAPSQRAFIQAYETNFLFSGTDLGIDFVKDNAGTTASGTWGFTYDASLYEPMTVNGRDMSVLEFEGIQNGEDVVGAVAVVTYTGGGYGYVLSYALSPVPATFIDDTLAVAASLDG